MKPLFQKEVQIKSHFTYQNFLKKGYRLTPKLALKLREKDGSSKEAKGATKKKIMRIFKNTRAIKRLDLTGLLVLKAKFWFSSFLCIAKKVSSTVSCLKMHDSRKRLENYQELVTSWPKYMKNIRSLSSVVFVEDARTKVALKQQKKIRPMNHYLKYLQKLAMIEIECSYNASSSDFSGIWKFEKYPASIKKIYFNQTRHGQEPINTSMTHLKNLKDLKFRFGNMYNNSVVTLKSVLSLIPQVPQLEALEIDFISYFEIDASIRAALKSLTRLKKVRFSLHQEMNLLPILKSLEGSPLEDFELSVDMYCDERIPFLKDFLSRKKDLKNLSLQIIKGRLFESFEEVRDLLKTIDDLPQLSSLSFEAKSSLEDETVKANTLPEIDFPFEKLFSPLRSIPLKKFRISLNQHGLSESGFMKLLASLKGVSPNLEELQIDVGEYKPKENTRTEVIIEFIKSLKNIRCLKLDSLDISQKQFFFELIEAIYGLKFLRDFSLGEFSEDVTSLSFIDGLRRILLKNGLEKFRCEMSEGLQKMLVEKDCPRIDRDEIRKKNPSHEKGPFQKLFINYSDEASW